MKDIEKLVKLRGSAKVDKKKLQQKQMREFMHQKFFMFYDFLQDGFIDFAMEFYEDPFNFDIDEAKARKEREEGGDDIENEKNVFDD